MFKQFSTQATAFGLASDGHAGPAGKHGHLVNTTVANELAKADTARIQQFVVFGQIRTSFLTTNRRASWDFRADS